MLWIGMIVEAIVFFISGFEKTYDKVPKSEGASVAGGQTVVVAGGGAPLPEGAEIPEGPIVIGGGAPVIAGGAPVGNIDPDALAAGTGLSAAAANLAAAGQAAAQAQLALEQIQNGGPAIDPNQIKATDPAVIEEAVKNYAEELTELTEVLGRVKAQAARMSTDSEEMENLNRTLTGICKVYEMQLKSASAQIGTIDDINDQTKKMAAQIAELNKIYSRMIEAMTAKMNA